MVSINEAINPSPDKVREEGKEGGADDDRTVGRPTENTGNRIRKWFEAIDAVSTLTHLNWNEVFDLPAISFLAYLKFWNYKVRKEEAAAEAFRRKQKH